MHEVQQYHSKDESPLNRTPCPGNERGVRVWRFSRDDGGARRSSQRQPRCTPVSHAARTPRTVAPARGRGHVARDPVAGRGWTAGPARTPGAAGILVADSQKTCKYAPT